MWKHEFFEDGDAWVEAPSPIRMTIWRQEARRRHARDGAVFAQLRDAAGLAAWDAEMPAGAIVGDVWRQAMTRHPAIAPFERAISCAVNATFARMTHRSPTATKSFLPPVSGG